MRRVFASAASALAYSYDPYGNALQGTAPLTDFNYAGMFYNADSGLYLTQYRAYDPVSGRWLSRDPIEETNDQPSFQDSTISTFAAASPRWNALSAAAATNGRMWRVLQQAVLEGLAEVSLNRASTRVLVGVRAHQQ